MSRIEYTVHRRKANVLGCYLNCISSIFNIIFTLIKKKKSVKLKLYKGVLGYSVRKGQGSPRSPAEGYRDDKGPGVSSVPNVEGLSSKPVEAFPQKA